MKVVIYNSIGQLIKNLDSSFKQSGTHKIEWNGENQNGHMVSSGKYFIVISSKNDVEFYGIILTK